MSGLRRCFNVAMGCAGAISGNPNRPAFIRGSSLR
jgi:hypothetical protein